MDLSNGGAGSEHERGDGRNRDAAEAAVSADPFHAGIVHLEPAMFEVDRCPSILCGSERFEGRTFE
jgi:hypothetical protein